MHPDDEVIQRLAHGELAAAKGRAVAEHLRACSGCRERRARLDEEDEQLDALLRHLDAPQPRVTLEQVVARARESQVAQGSRSMPATAPPRRGLPWVRWAAAIVIALGVASGAYAAPGSPLPGWLDAVQAWMRGGSQAASSGASSTPEPSRSPAGIAVDPGRSLAIVFASPQESGSLTILLGEGTQVVVRATGGAPGFGSELDRIVIENQGSTSDFEIEIPRGAPRVEVLVGQVRVFLLEGSRVTTRGASGDDGRFTVPWTEGEG
jgi:hypothetical protein